MDKARHTLDTDPKDDWSEIENGLSFFFLNMPSWGASCGGVVAYLLNFEEELANVDCDSGESHRDSSLTEGKERDPFWDSSYSQIGAVFKVRISR